jgi:hypothetical protein
VPEYGFRVPGFPYSSPARRDYVELLRRYPKLVVPYDLSRVVHSWVALPTGGWARPGGTDSLGSATVPLDAVARFEHEVSAEVATSEEAEAAGKPYWVADAWSAVGAAAGDGVRYGVRVLLLQGLSRAERDAVARGPHKEGGVHLVHALKFVTARFTMPSQQSRRGVLGALGGWWDPERDGGDPSGPQ